MQPDQSAAVSLEVLQQRMLALNSPDVPYVITVNGNTVEATWNIVDAKWHILIGKAGLKEVYWMTVTLNPADATAIYTDRQYQLQWQLGVPSLGPEITVAKAHLEFFQGKSYTKERGIAYGIAEDNQPGQLYNYSFDTKIIKRAVFGVLDQSGWKLKRSLLDKLFK